MDNDQEKIDKSYNFVVESYNRYTYSIVHNHNIETIQGARLTYLYALERHNELIGNQHDQSTQPD